MCILREEEERKVTKFTKAILTIVQLRSYHFYALAYYKRKSFEFLEPERDNDYFTEDYKDEREIQALDFLKNLEDEDPIYEEHIFRLSTEQNPGFFDSDSTFTNVRFTSRKKVLVCQKLLEF